MRDDVRLALHCEVCWGTDVEEPGLGIWRGLLICSACIREPLRERLALSLQRRDDARGT